MYVEFLGIPRERAGISEMEIDADTLGDLLEYARGASAGVGRAGDARGLHPSIVANLNGGEFVCDLRTKLAPGRPVVLVVIGRRGLMPTARLFRCLPANRRIERSRGTRADSRDGPARASRWQRPGCSHPAR